MGNIRKTARDFVVFVFESSGLNIIIRWLDCKRNITISSKLVLYTI